MCNCNKMCPKCDLGIEAFYQEKVKEAKEEVAYLKSIGIEMSYRDLLDAKDIWYEYCNLKEEQRADDVVENDCSSEIQKLVNNPQNEW